jgi:hypothetical protein
LSLDEPDENEVTVKVDDLDLLASTEAKRYIEVAHIKIFSNNIKDLK